MRKISLFFVLVLLITLVPSVLVSAADNRTDFLMEYDFDDYSNSEYNGVGPDAKWMYWNNLKRFKSGTGENTGTMEINGGTPVLKMDDDVIFGNLHVSFRAKTQTENPSFGFYLFRATTNDIRVTANSYYSRLVLLNLDVKNATSIGGVGWLPDVEGWSNNVYYKPEGFTTTEWHRYDIIRNAEGKYKYYVDGVLINQSNSSEANGLRTWGYCGFFSRDSSNTAWIDDLRVRRTMSDLKLEAKLGNERVSRENGELVIKFSEPVNQEALIKSNFTITNTSKGETFTDFEVTDLSDVSVKLSLNGELSSGIYNISLSDDIKGVISGKELGLPIEFKPEYKSEIVDGVTVIYPETESVKFLKYDGEELELGDSVTTGLNRIIIKFNTLINADTLENYITFTEDGVPKPYELSVDNSGETSVADIIISEMLKPASKYSFIIGRGIEAQAAAQVKSENEEKFLFDAAIDYVCGIYENNIDTDTGVYTFSIAKNTEDSVKLMGMAAVYQKVTTEIDGVQKEFEKLVECKCFPIVLDAEDIGSFSYTYQMESNLTRQDIRAVTYTIGYPDMLPVK